MRSTPCWSRMWRWGTQGDTPAGLTTSMGRPWQRPTLMSLVGKNYIDFWLASFFVKWQILDKFDIWCVRHFIKRFYFFSSWRTAWRHRHCSQIFNKVLWSDNHGRIACYLPVYDSWETHACCQVTITITVIFQGLFFAIKAIDKIHILVHVLGRWKFWYGNWIMKELVTSNVNQK